MVPERRVPPEAAVAAVTVRPVERGDGRALLNINRACPIEANFTFFFDRALPSDLQGKIRIDHVLGERLRQRDRFPFYGIVPARIDAAHEEA